MKDEVNRGASEVVNVGNRPTRFSETDDGASAVLETQLPRVLASTAFWALILALAHSLLIWTNPDWMYALPEVVRAMLILPFVPAMILFNTEMPPAWTNYTLVPASAFLLSWIAAFFVKQLMRACWRAVKGPF